MKDSARSIAGLLIVSLLGALGYVVYRGTASSSPASPPSPSSSSSPSPSPASAAALATTTGSSAATNSAGGGAPRFVASPDLSADEQAVLERLNEVRANPPAFYDHWRQFAEHEVADSTLPCKDDPPSQVDALKAYQARPPLAADQSLTRAARAHARDMIARSFMAHVNPEGIGPNQRAIAAGYPLPLNAPLNPEGNIYASDKDANQIEALQMRRCSSCTLDTAAFVEAIDSLVVDTCVPARGHRNNVLSSGGHHPGDREVGIGLATGPESGLSGMRVALEIAQRHDDRAFVLGVVYRDRNNNQRYDAGEGAADIDVTIAAAGVTTKTGPGGGYTLPVPRGTRGAVQVAEQSTPINVDQANVKVDFIVP